MMQVAEAVLGCGLVAWLGAMVVLWIREHQTSWEWRSKHGRLLSTLPKTLQCERCGLPAITILRNWRQPDMPVCYTCAQGPDHVPTAKAPNLVPRVGYRRPLDAAEPPAAPHPWRD